MTRISDLFTTERFQEERNKGNISVRIHPEFYNLAIANYTDQVAYKRDWNEVTRVCRGLIWDTETGRVLARPFEKFFNWDEKEAPRILDDQVVWHWDNKADGSLGIMYLAPDGSYRLATRGSFQSDQAMLGTDLLLKSLSSEELGTYMYMISEGYTPLFEIIGPSNRIVLRYDDDDLVHLGYIYIGTGQFVPPRLVQGRTMRDLLGDLSRSNAEGWVVWLSNTKALKIKQADYIELHRMVSNLTEKEVWRQLRAGTYSTYVSQLPDELYQLAEGWADALRDDFARIDMQAVIDMREVVMANPLSGGSTRKDQALWIQNHINPEDRGLVFGLLDGKDITDSIWRMLEPRVIPINKGE